MQKYSYKTIYLDPPWPHAAGGGKIRRGANRHYPLMKRAEILALPIQKLYHPDGAHVYLWCTNPSIPDALECLEVWGLEYVTCVTWMKDKIALGQYHRSITEHCLFATTPKKLPYKICEGRRQQGVTGFYAPRGEHSQKPEEMRQMIEKVSYAPRMELFARKEAEGWTCVGNEIDGKDIKQLLEDL